MQLTTTSYDPQLIKGIYFNTKGLSPSVENNHTLVEQSFHGMLLEVKDLKHHFLLSIDFIYWNTHLLKDSVQLHLKGLY